MEVDQDNSHVYAGQCIVHSLNELEPGQGTYSYRGKIFSQHKGTQHIASNKITVTPLHQPQTAAQSENPEVQLQDTPQQGQLVHCRVSKIEDKFCKVEILAIEGRPTAAPFVGVLPQEQVRDFEKSSVALHNCFRPGDVVAARVTAGVTQGTSRELSVLLSTAEEECGVVFARSPYTGALMVPRSWSEFECVQTKTRHKRKVAKP